MNSLLYLRPFSSKVKEYQIKFKRKSDLDQIHLFSHLSGDFYLLFDLIHYNSKGKYKEVSTLARGRGKASPQDKEALRIISEKSENY